jgi:hypothetical protein
MIDDDTLAAIVFAALIMATLGWVLLAHLLVRRLTVFVRALLATALGVLFFVLPIVILGDEADFSLFVFGAAVTTVIGFPIAYFAAGERDSSCQLMLSLGAVFE